MKPLFKDEIALEEHRFMILTGLNKQSHQVVCEVLEKGHPIYRKYADLPVEFYQSEEDFWNEQAQNTHERMKEEIQAFFVINEKLKKVTNYHYHYRFGRILLSYNFIDEAIEHFNITIDTKPDFVKAHRKLAACYLKKKEFGEAKYILKKAIDSGCSFPDIYNDLAVAHILLGEYTLAKDMLQKALEKKADFPEADFNLGLLLFFSSIDEKQEQKAAIPVRVIRALKKLKQAYHLNDRFWQSHIDDILERINAKDDDSIIPMLRDLQIKIATRDDPAALEFDFFFLKFMFGKRALSDEELEYYEQTISEEVRQKSKYADYWNDLGVIHLIQSRNYFLKALEEIEEATELNPNFTEAQETLEKIRRIKSGLLILLRALLKG